MFDWDKNKTGQVVPSYCRCCLDNVLWDLLLQVSAVVLLRYVFLQFPELKEHHTVRTLSELTLTRRSHATLQGANERCKLTYFRKSMTLIPLTSRPSQIWHHNDKETFQTSIFNSYNQWKNTRRRWISHSNDKKTTAQVNLPQNWLGNGMGLEATQSHFGILPQFKVLLVVLNCNVLMNALTTITGFDTDS